MNISWLKFAILGSTYARALGNAATRGGRALAPAMENKLTQMSAQPQAKLQPGLGQMFREHAGGGALTPTPQQAGMQKMLAKVPWAGGEHGGTPHAEATYNAMLKRRGMDVQTPGGDTSAQIAKSFGVGAREPSDSQTAVTRRTNVQPGAVKTPDTRKPLEHLDRRLQTPNPIEAGPAEDVPQARPIQRARPAEPLRPPAGWKPPPMQSLQAMHSVPVNTSPGGAATNVLTAPPPQRDVATSVLKAGADRFKIAGPLATAAGIGIPLAIGGSILASKPGIRADIADRFNAPGDIHQKDVAQEIPQEVQGQATRAHQALMERGINPTGLRIAVDAPSGAGKTVLSKALASQMGLRHHGLDWRPNLRFHQLMGGGDIEKTPYAPHAGEILEHQQLLRSYDPELFDVAIHIHKDPATIKAQVLKRGRGARTHDLLDYDKSIAVGRKAFETLGGESIDLGGGVMMKVRPQEGWGNMLDQQLAQRGIDPSGLTRHQKLLSLHSGQREEHGAGWTPYMKSPFTGGETAALAASVPLGVMAARALTHHP